MLNITDNDWINKELSLEYSESYTALSEGALNNIGERYKFSRYVVDPNKFRFKKVVRIVGLVLLFIKNLHLSVGKISSFSIVPENKLPTQFKFSNDQYLLTQGKNDFPLNCKAGLVVYLSDEILNIALDYFYKKASLEIKHFQTENVYKNIASKKNGILYYTGRILPSQKINNELNLSDVCIDLTMSSFCVPLVEKLSPLAYSLVNEIHWYDDDAKHSGNETVMRCTKNCAYH